MRGRRWAGGCDGSGGVLMIWRRGAGGSVVRYGRGFLEAIGFAFDGDDFGVVQETVDQRDDAGGVGEHLAGHLVTADDARALYGVLMLDGAAKGFLTTTSDFAPLLTKDALLGPVIPSRIELINGKRLLARLEELSGKR